MTSRLILDHYYILGPTCVQYKLRIQPFCFVLFQRSIYTKSNIILLYISWYLVEFMMPSIFTRNPGPKQSQSIVDISPYLTVCNDAFWRSMSRDHISDFKYKCCPYTVQGFHFICSFFQFFQQMIVELECYRSFETISGSPQSDPVLF